MTVRSRARAVAYRTAYRIPARWRRRIVRLFVQKYVIGSVILVRDADAADPGRMLLLRQGRGDAWSLPAGLLNRNERPVDAAVRELFEETGVRAEPDQLRPANPNSVVHTYGTWVDCVFEVSISSDVNFVVDGGEVLEARWHGIDSLPPLTVPTARLLAVYGIGPYVGYPEALER
jgi:8-oxo-dGTP pyrophosphatase MutT (NUDIX family)